MSHGEFANLSSHGILHNFVPPSGLDVPTNLMQWLDKGVVELEVAANLPNCKQLLL